MPVNSREMHPVFLVGPPNCGKSTLFGALTGSLVLVGNRAGVTVSDTTAAVALPDGLLSLTDLPGMRAPVPATPEEEVTAARIRSCPDADLLLVISAPEWYRYVSFLSEMTHLYPDRRMALVLTMADEMADCGFSLNIPALSAQTGLACLTVSAPVGEGLPALLSLLCRHDFRPPRPVSRESLLRPLSPENGRSSRPREDRLDRLLIAPLTGLPVFLLVMLLVFCLVFGAPGNGLAKLAERLLTVVCAPLTSLMYHAPVGLAAFWQDCLFPVLLCLGGLIPRLFLLDLSVTLLDDCGYLARVSALLDDKLKLAGLSGKAAVSILLGWGCTVPALLSVRTLTDSRQRVRCLLSLPFITCSARVPLLLYLSASFGYRWRVAWIALIYGLGLLSFLWVSVILRFCGARLTEKALWIELPRFRRPNVKTALRFTLRKSKQFIGRISQSLLLSFACLWLLSSFTRRGTFTTVMDDSLLAGLASRLVPLFRPLGMEDYRLICALLVGLGGKELVLSSLLSLHAVPATPSVALSFGLFASLCVPCFSTIMAQYQELKREKRRVPQTSWRPLPLLLGSFLCLSGFAYGVTFLVFRLFLAFYS